MPMKNLIIAVLCAALLSSCATLMQDYPPTEYQKTEPQKGEPRRQLKTLPLAVDLVTGVWPLLVDFYTNKIYKEQPKVKN